MAIVGDPTVQQVSATSIIVFAVSDIEGATFYWWRNGIFVGSDIMGFRQFEVDPTETARISVFDDADDVPDDAPLPGRVTVYWDATPEAVKYEVYQENNSLRASSPELVITVQDNDLASFVFESEYLQDLNIYEWTVYAINEAGNSSPARTMLQKIVRRPTIATGAYDYVDGTGVLTFTQA